MPTVASDIAGSVRELPFPRKQIPEPAVIYNRCADMSNTKPACFYMYLNSLTCNSLVTLELEKLKRDSIALAQLSVVLTALLTLRKGNET
jgi:hypothetical protein